MKTLVKLFCFLLAVALLVGCAPKPTPVPVVPTAAPTQAPTTAPTEAPSAAPTEVPTQAPPEPVTIRYANWNLGTEAENNINRQMIKAFTDAHPWVTVELVDMADPNGVGWEGVLTAYAAKGELPDVWMANDTSLYIKNDWLYDLTDTLNADPDYATVPQVLKDVMTYKGKIIAIPAGIFIMGYWANMDLFEAANLDAPYYGMSVDEFFQSVKDVTNIDKNVLGLNDQWSVPGWYPRTQDPNLGWFSFDGVNMNYNSAPFKAAIAKGYEMNPYTWYGLTDAQKATFKTTEAWLLYSNQEVAYNWDGSWSMGYMQQNYPWNWDFVGFPGGNQVMVFDPFGISKTTKNFETAYDFAKWMTFSIDGYKKKCELLKAMNSAPDLPISITPETLALFKTFLDKPGIMAALANLDKSPIESLAKVIPGYIDARWTGKPGIDVGDNKDVSIGQMFDFALQGMIKYEDYSAQLEQFANQILAKARESMP
jgi:ABC-type glycerol-3-phosphate transport system substrate-binding protein